MFRKILVLVRGREPDDWLIGSTAERVLLAIG